MLNTENSKNNKRPIRAKLLFSGNRTEHWQCENREQLTAAVAENYTATGCFPLVITIENPESLPMFVVPVLRTNNPEADLFIAQQEKAMRKEEFELARRRLMQATRRVNDLQATIHFNDRSMSMSKGKGGQL